uniref:olfactory receptor 8A1-like n=1 Tax=Centroberyx gerrardi TaxID=166262 RepID=UPI003AAFB7C0
MINDSEVELLVLLGFKGLDHLKYLYFCITFAGYLVIIVLNVSILVLICCKQSLHEPMYIFLANLLVNSLYGCAVFYPKLLHDLLSNVQVISRAGCIVQAYCVHTYVSVECNILTVMAYDRYAAISRPLMYRNILIIIFRVSKTTRAKSLSTCVPHLVTYISFVLSIAFEVAQPALAAHDIPHVFRVIMSMEGFLVLPILNPIIYGIKLPKIRNNISSMFNRRIQLAVPL